MSASTYQQAGVDLEASDRLKARLDQLVGVTHGPEVLSDMAGFCSLFTLPGPYAEPVLVAATDGVGTKLLLAESLGRLDGLGQDLVAMCVNDLVTCGARPLFFLDYIAVGRFDAQRIETLIVSIAHACRRSGLALVGGETAQMPGVYAPEHFDLAGFCVGVVERSDMLGPRRVAAGDALLGLPSNGLHANGFSLVRSVLGNQPTDLADEVLRPTQLYPSAVEALVGAGGVHAIAHITGGGLPGNVRRILPKGLRGVIHTQRWKVPGIFRLIAERGRIGPGQMFRTFNMGIGMVLAAAPERVDALLAQSSAGPVAAGLCVIGEIAEGDGDVELR